MNFIELSQIDIYSWEVILILIIAGFMVGIINTLAGSGTIITYSLFMLLGLPANFANGTIRLGVIMQTLAASLTFKKGGVLDVKKGLKLGIPIVIGSVVGAQIAATINKDIFEKVVAVVMIMMLFFIFFDPKKWIQGQAEKIAKKPNALQIVIFFFIGLYGGFIHIGVGIFLLAGLVLNAGYDLVRANALKVFIVLLYSPFALIVFMLNDQVHFAMGLISAIGNIFGGIVASHFAISWGAKFIRWVLIIIIILFTGKLLGIYDLFF
jgi:uncharacterized protein